MIAYNHTCTAVHFISCSLYSLFLLLHFMSFRSAFFPFNAPQQMVYSSTKAPATENPLIVTHSYTMSLSTSCDTSSLSSTATMHQWNWCIVDAICRALHGSLYQPISNTIAERQVSTTQHICMLYALYTMFSHVLMTS